MATAMHWVDQLPTTFKLSAYKAGEELAWSRLEALEVLAWLDQHNFVVLGVDIWLPTTPGPTIPTPYVYDWDVETAAISAKEFVKLFRWHQEDLHNCAAVPYFAIGPVEAEK